jgi:hypothetical protein
MSAKKKKSQVHIDSMEGKGGGIVFAWVDNP